MSLVIRPVTERDRDALWAVISPVLRAGETYALPTDWDRASALDFWIGGDHSAFIAEDGGQLVGSYYLHPNQRGGGAHVANCGYIVDRRSEGRGHARAMALHSLALAAERGFRAMQFNFVVSSNERAVRLWQSLGFAIVGRLPGAFRHPRLGFIDALVMYRTLDA